MLRITRVVNDGTATVRLEGKLLEPWVETLRSECAAARDAACDAGGRLVLDLTGVSFVDVAGARAVREQIQRGHEVVGCRGFIKELLGVGQ